MFGLRRTPKWDIARLTSCMNETDAALLKGKAWSRDTAADLGVLGSVPAELGARAAKETGRVAGHVLLAAMRREKVHWNNLDALLHASGAAAPSAGLARDLFAYLTAARELDRFTTENALDKARTEAFARSQGALLAIVEATETAFPGAPSLDILRGAIVGLTDRSAAAPIVRRAVSGGPDSMATSVFDLGAHTYFSEADLSDGDAAGDADGDGDGDGDGYGGFTAAVRSALADRADPFRRPRTNLLISVDLTFLRIYGPYWFNLAPYLLRDGLGLAIAVVGEPDAVAQAVAESRDLIARTARFHALPDAEACGASVVFIPMVQPPDLGEARTFYACARYLLAPALIEEDGAPVLTLDADYTVRDAILPFVNRLMDHDVAVTSGLGLGVIWPWRRHLAGTTWFNATDGGRAALATMGRYIRAGLKRSPSWTLDQNALTYLQETTPAGGIHDINGERRPFYQDRLRTVFEQAWRDTQATNDPT